LEGLRAWSYELDEERKTFSKEPRHDWASHPGDGFSYGAQVMRELVQDKPKPKFEVNTRLPTYDEIARMHDKGQRSRRIG
jgi:phage terminase large subunit